MTQPDPTANVQRAKRHLFARLVASAHLLDKPFSNQPDLSVWALLKRDMEALDAALKDAWVVPKTKHDDDRSVTPHIRGGWISRAAGQSDPEHTRFYAALLLAAADEAETTGEAS